MVPSIVKIKMRAVIVVKKAWLHCYWMMPKHCHANTLQSFLLSPAPCPTPRSMASMPWSKRSKSMEKIGRRCKHPWKKGPSGTVTKGDTMTPTSATASSAADILNEIMPSFTNEDVWECLDE